MEEFGSLTYVIAVFGSRGPDNPYAKAAGTAIARSGHDLLTGGGNGCMRSALEGFLQVNDRKGRSHAILPLEYPVPAGYDQVIQTKFSAPKDMGESPYSRNLVNVAFCHACLFITGSPGTLTEVVWMLRLNKPCAYFGPGGDLPEIRERLALPDLEKRILVHPVRGPEQSLEQAANQCVDALIHSIAEFERALAGNKRQVVTTSKVCNVRGGCASEA